MNTPNTVEKVAKEHARETGYRPSLLNGPLKVIINKTNQRWTAKKIADWMEETAPGTPYTQVDMVTRAQRDLGY